MSGNFEVGQGILEIKQKVREMSGNFEITSLCVIKHQECRLRQFILCLAIIIPIINLIMIVIIIITILKVISITFLKLFFEQKLKGAAPFVGAASFASPASILLKVFSIEFVHLEIHMW